jgi:hypothetical protein
VTVAESAESPPELLTRLSRSLVTDASAVGGSEPQTSLLTLIEEWPRRNLIASMCAPTLVIQTDCRVPETMEGETLQAGVPNSWCPSPSSEVRGPERSSVRSNEDECLGVRYSWPYEMLSEHA